MTWPTFPTSPSPSFPWSETHTPRSLSAKFGNGYSQDIIDGINTDEYSAPVVWNDLYGTEKDTIVNFLKTVGSAGRFLFTPPVTPPATGTQQTFICPTYKVELTKANVWQISATFQRKYDVG